MHFVERSGTNWGRNLRRVCPAVFHVSIAIARFSFFLYSSAVLLDLLSSRQDTVTTAEVDVRGAQVIERLMVSLVVVANLYPG